MLHPDTTPCAPLPPGHDRRRRVGIRRGELGRPVWAELRRHAPELELVPGGAEVPRLEPADCEGMLGAPRLGRMPDHPEFHGVVPALRDPRIHAVRVRLEDAASLGAYARSEEHTSELQSRLHLVCRLLLEKKNEKTRQPPSTHSLHM